VIQVSLARQKGDNMNQADIHNKLPGASTDITLRDLLAPLFRRKRLLLIVFSFIFLSSVLAAFVLSRQYAAHMDILVNRERLDPMVTTEATNQITPLTPPVTEQEINSEVELLQSRDLLEKVVLANGLQGREKESLLTSLLPKQSEEKYISRAVEHLAKKLRVTVVPRTNVIDVSYTSSDPQTSYAVLSTLADLYLEKHIAVHRPAGSYDFFTKEADKYRQALEESEGRLASFADQEGVVAPDVERTMMSSKLVDSMAELQHAKQAVSADEQRIREEVSQQSAMPARSSTQEISTTADSLPLQQLQAALLAAKIKRTQLALKYDPSYPLVQEADEEIQQTQAAIEDAQKTRYVSQTTDRDATYELLREDVAKTQADLASQRATAGAIQTTIRSFRKQLVDVDQKALKQASLLRETKANEANYLLYLSKREQERTSDALDKKRIANVAIAEPPAIPALPAHSPLLFVLVGLFLAISMSTAIAYTADYIDPAFRTPAEIIEVLNIPVLGAFTKQST